MKELVRGFRRQRIRWRNAFLLGSIMTTIIILLHTPTFSIFSDDEESESSSSSPIYLNGSLHLNIQIVREAKVESFPSLTTTPVVKMNSSSEFKRVDEETNLPRKRRKGKRRKKTKVDLIVTDPPPAPRHVLSSSEVSNIRIIRTSALRYLINISILPIIFNRKIFQNS